MRSIRQIIIHHTATSLSATTEDIRQFHLDRGWNDIGYHFVIEADGSIYPGRHIRLIGAHAKNNNRFSIGIALVGNNLDPANAWTPYQEASLKLLLQALKGIFPEAEVIGHSDVRPTQCPGTSVEQFTDPWSEP